MKRRERKERNERSPKKCVCVSIFVTLFPHKYATQKRKYGFFLINKQTVQRNSSTRLGLTCKISTRCGGGLNDSAQVSQKNSG